IFASSSLSAFALARLFISLTDSLCSGSLFGNKLFKLSLMFTCTHPDLSCFLRCTRNMFDLVDRVCLNRYIIESIELKQFLRMFLENLSLNQLPFYILQRSIYVDVISPAIFESSNTCLIKLSVFH